MISVSDSSQIIKSVAQFHFGFSFLLKQKQNRNEIKMKQKQNRNYLYSVTCFQPIIDSPMWEVQKTETETKPKGFSSSPQNNKESDLYLNFIACTIVGIIQEAL